MLNQSDTSPPPRILCLGPTRGDNESENESENENENKNLAQDGAVTPHRKRVPIMLMSLLASVPISFQMSNFFSLYTTRVACLIKLYSSLLRE